HDALPISRTGARSHRSSCTSTPSGSPIGHAAPSIATSPGRNGQPGSDTGSCFSAAGHGARRSRRWRRRARERPATPGLAAREPDPTLSPGLRLLGLFDLFGLFNALLGAATCGPPLSSRSLILRVYRHWNLLGHRLSYQSNMRIGTRRIESRVVRIAALG